jgi:hypothetical protein
MKGENYGMHSGKCTILKIITEVIYVNSANPERYISQYCNKLVKNCRG